MANPTPKLSYFGIPGRAEPIRCLCAANDIQFEDERFGFPEWPARKPNAPYNTVPTLELPGKAVIPSSNAILRYFGKQCGAYPSDLFLAAHVDAFLDGFEDLAGPLGPSMKETDNDKKKALREAWVQDHALPWLARFQKQHEALGSPKCLVSDQLTIADYKAASFIGWIRSGNLDFVPKETAEKAPCLLKAFEAVYGQEKVKAYKASGK